MLYFDTLPLEIPSQHYPLPPPLFTDGDLKNQTKGNTAELVKEIHSGQEMETEMEKGGFFTAPGKIYRGMGRMEPPEQTVLYMMG